MKTLEHHKSNLFIAILGISAALIFLAILILNVFQKQGLQGRAYKSLGCDTNRDCPESTICRGGTCILNNPVVTQTPLSYVNVNSIVEKPISIPAIYASPTPTLQVNFLAQVSEGVNNTVVSVFELLGNIFNSLLKKLVP
ncbi:hypothetical protein HY030_02020 [Candidatus Gottesmanbacteria bacterium]|nr:hypothetical protein [Candidatus Gottesmanbacteria bacterium]